ncbi:MAG: SMP-30/gluconolactonase/LRE family protein [Streptosporangiaceae bacterium]
MQSTMLASGLGFPEGQTVLPDGRVVFCDGNTGELLVYSDGTISRFANTGGSPWGTYLGTDGKLYVNQGGNVPGSGDFSAVPGIQRVSMDGSVEFLFSEVGGYTLAAPNQAAFGPDGRLWITDSGTELDDRVEVPSPGRLFVVSDASGTGEMVLERPGSYPNGIAFDRQGRFYWSESKAHRVCRLENGEAVTFCQLPDTHVPDGMKFAADGRLFVANTTFGGVSVLSAEGEVLTEIDLNEHATNVVFDGSTMYVAATKVPDIEASQRTGSLWKVETDATGLPLLPGRL